MSMERTRVDKWLWAARFYKTRSLATQAVDGGQVRLHGERIKPAREVNTGDLLRIRNEGGEFTVRITGIADKRGSASIAQTLYDETPESVAARAAERDKGRRLADPSEGIFARPTKKDRRNLDRFRGG
jgi:ribosome-associated heat shock protein Hsp15